MDAVQIHLLRKSFAEIERQTHVAALDFYRRLFDLDPRLRPMFSTEIEQQACKLMDMLSLSISLLERPAELMPELEQLGARHVGYGVRAEHYDTVSTALFGMLAAVLRDKYTAPVEAAWRELYRVIRDTMLRGATGGSTGDRPGARPGA